MRRTTHLLTVLVGVALVISVGCRFDDSALTARGPCDTDDDCSPGLCLAGNCVDATLVDGGGDFDGGTTDTGGASDVGGVDSSFEDSVSCAEGFAECLGDTARRCEDGVIVEVDCATPRACDADDCTCAGGACVERVCVSGDRRCSESGGSAEVCADDGASWVEFEVCDDDEACVGGQCVVAECSPEARDCIGETIVICDASGQWEEVQNCTVSDAWCDVGDEGPVCRPRICTPGTSRCVSETQAEGCNDSGSDWSLEDPCLDSEACIDGACVPSTCAPESTTCLDEVTLGVCGSDGTLVRETCEGGRCIEGPEGAACGVGFCPIGATRCTGVRTGYETCNGDAWVGPTLCSVSEFCEAGACVDDICEAGARSCDGPDIVECDGVGGGYTIIPCGDGTSCLLEGSTASCRRLVCEPGALRCTSPTSRQQCNDLGTAWRSVDGCSAGSVCVDGTCTDTVCEPGDGVCVDAGTVRRCSDDGTVEIVEICPGDQICQFGACVDDVCTPGARFCVGDDVRRCNVVGDGSDLLETCLYGCDGGFCDELACGDGTLSEDTGEACDDGNDDPCDACDACELRGIGSLTASSVTTSGPSWVPAESDVTIEFWVRGSGSGSLVGIGDSSMFEVIYVGLDRGRPFVQATFLSGRGIRAASTATIDDGAWHHIAAQRISRDGVAIWVNGRLRDTAYLDLPATSIDEGAMWLGSDGTLTSASADIDEVRISGRSVYADRFTPAPRLAGGARDVQLHLRLDQTSGPLESEGGSTSDMTVSGFTLDDGECFAESDVVACGDGRRAPWEWCDDGNTIDGDGCDATCVTEIACGTGVSGPNGQCYVTVAPTTFNAAHTQCTSLGGALVTVNHAVENLFLQRAYPSTTPWIGAWDYRAEGTWVWRSGSTATYRNWASGEPDGGRAQNCASITTSTGLWSDQNCASPVRGGICEL